MGLGHRTRYSGATPKRRGSRHQTGGGRRTATLGAALALVVVLVARPRRLEVRGASMLPALQDGDRVVAWWAWRLRAGDVVAALDPRDSNRLLVKRLVSSTAEGLWLEGDNAAASTDSRQFGPVRREHVVGRVAYRYSPPGRAGTVARGPRR